MHSLPSELRAALPTGGLPVADAWWLSLSDAEQQQISQLWDERLEVKFFTPQSNEEGRIDGWEQVPVVEGGKFVPHDDAFGLSEWGPGYFEHLLQHPELVLAYDAERRTFHIGCTLHEAARLCLATRVVPIEFVCPVRASACPLEKLRGSRLTVPN